MGISLAEFKPLLVEYEIPYVWNVQGYDSIMDGTVTVPTLDKLLLEKDEAVVKAGHMVIKLNKSGCVDLMLSMSNVNLSIW